MLMSVIIAKVYINIGVMVAYTNLFLNFNEVFFKVLSVAFLKIFRVVQKVQKQINLS